MQQKSVLRQLSLNKRLSFKAKTKPPYDESTTNEVSKRVDSKRRKVKETTPQQGINQNYIFMLHIAL